jgi:hypothetical protein
MALERALGIAAPADADHLDARLVQLETASVYLWLLLLELQRALGRPPRLDLLAPLHRLLQRDWPRVLGEGWPRLGQREAVTDCRAPLEEVQRIAEQALFGAPIADWLQRWQAEDATAVLDWIRQGEAPGAGALRAVLEQGQSLWQVVCPTMPSSISEAFVEELTLALEREPAFALRPHHRGRALETGALARQAERLSAIPAAGGVSGVVRRLLARLLELAQIVRALEGEGASPQRLVGGMGGGGVGVGWVETARGLLIHRVELVGGRVRRYQIVAPTEWNFHPQGALARALRQLPGGGAAAVQRRATLLVLGGDPWVDYRRELR